MFVNAGWHPINGDGATGVARPRSALIAVVLLYATLLPDMAIFVLFGGKPLSAPILFSSILLTGFAALLIYKISHGRQWARSSYLVVYILFCLNIPDALTHIAAESGGRLALGIVYLSANLLELAALILLFTSASNDWFRQGGRADLSREEAVWKVSASRPSPPPPSSLPPPPE